jgi:pimeloyl-ACP methyl ester carboxylesterase
MEAAWIAYWRPLFGPSTPACTLAAARRIALAQDVDDMVRGVRAFHDRRDLRDFALGWAKPIIVVSGDHDRTPSPPTAASITRSPNRQFHLIRDCGHYVNLERPSEFAAVLTAAIDGLSDPR